MPLIDVRELIQRLTPEELLQAADDYFAGLTLESEQCYKPFSNVADALHLHRSLALVLHAADLFRGAQVLDFGCGTGWLSLSLANMGCDVIGVDIAPKAVSLAQQWSERRGVRRGTSVTYRVYDGRRLPLADESVERIVCFDAFHHVPDQAATIRECARVLRPGGRIAMVEPGPNHSRTAQSQMEMARYKVIENDVDMAAVASAARDAGLDAPTMLVQPSVPLEMPVEHYLAWARSSEMPRRDAEKVLGSMTRQLTATQSFYIVKPGTAVLDSRDPAALAGHLRLLSVTQGSTPGRWRFRISSKNTGEGIWRAHTEPMGRVQLGVQLLDGTGTVVKLDFQRVPLAADVPPGAEAVLEMEVDLTGVSTQALRFDLVSELVCWFADRGRTRPLDWKPTGT